MLTLTRRKPIGVTLRTVNEAARSWALRALMAGSPDTRRVIETENANGVRATFQLDLPAHKTVDNYRVVQKVEWRLSQGEIGTDRKTVSLFSSTPPSRHGRTRRLNENSAPGIYRSDACGQRPGNAASSRAGREPLPDRARCCS